MLYHEKEKALISWVVTRNKPCRVTNLETFVPHLKVVALGNKVFYKQKINKKNAQKYMILIDFK